MNDIPQLSLMSGENIFVPHVGTVRQPKLKEISYYESIFGENSIASFLALIRLDVPSLIDLLGIKKQLDQIDEEYKKDLVPFDIFISNQYCRESLSEGLSFFMLERLVFDNAQLIFWVVDDNGKVVGVVSRETFNELMKVIMTITARKIPDTKPKIYKSQKAREIAEKLAEGRKQMSKSSGEDLQWSISNIISSICVGSNSYNLLNVFDLTLYQLYDQYDRLLGFISFNVYSTRWAAWGDKEFDCTVWSKPPERG